MDQSITPLAQRKKIGLINASGLHMGLLTGRGAASWHPAPTAVHEAGRKVAQICRAHGADLSQMALRFCLDHPYVASTLVGMSTVEQVEANLDLFKMKTDPNLLQKIRSAIGPAFNHVWPSGRPENYG